MIFASLQKYCTEKWNDMKVLIILAAFITVTAKECSKKTNVPELVTKETSADILPSCIQQKIDSIKKQPKWNPPAEVDEYVYNGKTVYLFSADCCDQYYVVYDAQCNYVCAPSGGMTGKGDLKCEDFNTAAKLTRIVWKDER
jgi:hypothetical protein